MNGDRREQPKDKQRSLLKKFNLFQRDNLYLIDISETKYFMIR